MATESDLQSARAALHDLLTGKRVASLQKNGRGITYTPASLGDLKTYITQLESELGHCVGRRSPARFYT